MEDNEFIQRLYKFLDKHLKAFINYPTDIGELNELMMELEHRIRIMNK